MEHSWGGENKYPNELVCPGGIAPFLHYQQSLSHGPGRNLIDPLLNYFFALFHFDGDALTSCLIIKHYCLPSHIFGPVMANDLESRLRQKKKSGSQQCVWSLAKRQGHWEERTQHHALKSARWDSGKKLTVNISSFFLMIAYTYRDAHQRQCIIRPKLREETDGGTSSSMQKAFGICFIIVTCICKPQLKRATKAVF